MSGSTNFLMYMTNYCLPHWHLADSHSKEGSNGCQNINK